MQLIPSLEWTFTFLLLLNISCINSEPRKRRNENLPSCLDNFDVHKDKIIRTQDSRSMGAKYLNERDVNSRDECLRLCCETNGCDVFVFEERTPGSCYLFQCGSSDDFKCKFTKHQNYTSAILAVDRQLAELESQIKLTQHEHELTKLREPTPIINLTSTPVPKTKEVEQYLQTPNERKDCSHYQFQCHTSKECIAIYNACDGIPQCADGSDEAAALNCPSQRTLTPIVTQAPVISENYKVVGHPEHQEAVAAEGMLKNWHNQNYEHQQIHNLPANQMVNVPLQRANYGREGEGMPNNYRQEMQWNEQYQQNPGMTQIFTHKGNGLVPQTDRFQPQRPFIQPHVSSRNMAPYNEQGPDNKYYYENGPYKMFPQNQPQNWQPPRRNEEGRVEPQPNVIPPDYYYEDAYRNRQSYGPKFEANNLPEKTKIERPTVEVHTTPKSVKEDKIHQANRKMEKLTVESKSKETPEEIYGHSTSPSGAILSLSMGLCITAIMVVLVGCRMRMVRRRVRRNGKSGYAHDADFLVNGMYL